LLGLQRQWPSIATPIAMQKESRLPNSIVHAA
jgi:hypothetical protein